MRILVLLIIFSSISWALEEDQLDYLLSKEHTFKNNMNEIKEITFNQIKLVNKEYKRNERNKFNKNRFSMLTWPEEKEMMAYYMNLIIRE